MVVEFDMAPVGVGHLAADVRQKATRLQAFEGFVLRFFFAIGDDTVTDVLVDLGLGGAEHQQRGGNNKEGVSL